MSANEKPSFAEILAARGADAGLKFTEQQLEQFTKYYELLVETNKVMNLTALTEPEEVAVKHMIDSLLAYDEDMAGKTLADVGTGAGFPGVPLKIYCPELKVTLIDALGKRLRFLQQVIDTLGLKYIRCEHLRAEDAGKNSKHREKYDLVTARAVARLSVLAEYCLPLVKKGGRFIALKGAGKAALGQQIEEGLKMIVDDGFSVLDADFGSLGENKAVNEVKVIKVPIDQIFPNPYQPRKTFDDEALADLASSIAQYGVLQPLLVAPAEDGRYLLIAGERRLRASRMAKLTEVPVIISEYSSQEIAEIALIENLQREDLHFLEEAEGYEQLMEQFHLTQEAMAARVGKKQSTIANKLRLLRLSGDVRKLLVEHELSERHARALLKIEDEAQRLEVLDIIIKRNYSVRQTDEYIAKLLADKQQEKKKRFVIVNDVRIYLNSIKQVVNAIKDVGIPASMEQTVEGDEVIVSLRIKNQKKPKGGNSKPLF